MRTEKIGLLSFKIFNIEINYISYLQHQTISLASTITIIYCYHHTTMIVLAIIRIHYSTMIVALIHYIVVLLLFAPAPQLQLGSVSLVLVLYYYYYALLVLRTLLLLGPTTTK